MDSNAFIINHLDRFAVSGRRLATVHVTDGYSEEGNWTGVYPPSMDMHSNTHTSGDSFVSGEVKRSGTCSPPGFVGPGCFLQVMREAFYSLYFYIVLVVVL